MCAACFQCQHSFLLSTTMSSAPENVFEGSSSEDLPVHHVLLHGPLIAADEADIDFSPEVLEEKEPEEEFEEDVRAVSAEFNRVTARMREARPLACKCKRACLSSLEGEWQEAQAVFAAMDPPRRRDTVRNCLLPLVHGPKQDAGPNGQTRVATKYMCV